MKYLETFFVISLNVLIMLQLASADFVQDEEGISELQERHYKRCKTHSDCPAGYHCRYGRWCYPKQPCSIHSHCKSDQFCDTSDYVCKPGQRICQSHRECGYYGYCKNGICAKKECHYYGYACEGGYTCVRPGICQKKCRSHSHCNNDQCCIKPYGQRYWGVCAGPVAANGWCDLKGRQTCSCIKGYTCKRYSPWWGKCVPEPTEEPGSGDLEEM